VNIVYDDLITRTSILDKLSVNLLISNVIILKNDPFGKSNKAIKTTYIGKKDTDEIEKAIQHCTKYRDELNELLEYSNNLFANAKIEKALLNFDKKLTDMCLQSII
jgi:hypothetical protein